MSKVVNEGVELQKKQVFSGDAKVKLIAPCTPKNGIVVLTEAQKEAAKSTFDNSDIQPVFFIPASGSGSRMFQFLFEWLETKVETPLVKDFFEKVKDLPFFQSRGFSTDLLNNKEVFVRHLLDSSQLNFGNRPKGLFAFHQENDKFYTAFQDQVRQAFDLINNDLEIHFTVQKNFEKEIKSNIKALDLPVKLNFSYQEEATNAFCFDENQDLIFENDEPLRRPAGHGAILDNLNAIDADVLLIKNIDNVQHNSKSAKTAETWKEITGLLYQFQGELKELASNYSKSGIIALNEKYNFLSSTELDGMNEEKLILLTNRPSRVCGMVKNEGEPGGGPFWIESKGKVTNQIIEKIQISTEADQQKIVSESTHFNPVFIAASKTNCFGERLNLLDFRDDSAFFVVEKSQHGKKVFYRELPGLWNGAMSNWNTIFVEISSETFSPVKTIMDLIKVAHLE